MTDRPFAAVICESIERVARRTYFGTKIEYQLEHCGVTLCAADEPIATTPGARKATPTLTRRVKQAVAEWYVLQMLELSLEGTIEHTRQGWNIGKPPYGYAAEKVPHPVPAKRAEGRTKHRLVPHPVQGPVVTRIFAMRAVTRLGYDLIADRLNLDLTLNPPPEPTRPESRLGRWTASAVREVLINPKHTGYMVYNRRASKNGNRNNPPSEWVWSPHPVHEPLVTRENFDAAATLAQALKGPRAGRGANPHPATKNTYLLRSYLWCALCGRRMWGKTQPSGRVHYYCEKDRRQHADAPWYNQHLTSLRLSEDAIKPLLHKFFTTHTFTTIDPTLTSETITPPPFPTAWHPAQAVQQQIATLKRRQARLIEELETLGETHHGPRDLDQLRASIHRRFVELGHQISAKTTEYSALRYKNDQPSSQASDTLSATTALAEASMEVQRVVFETYNLHIRYHHPARTITIIATIDGRTVTETHSVNSVRQRRGLDD